MENFKGVWYKLTEPDHLGLSEIIEIVQPLENYDKMLANSSYGVYVSNDNYIVIPENKAL